VSSLKAAQQLVERVQHLLGQALAYLVLELAAVIEECGEALRAWQAKEPRFADKQPQRGRDRPACGLHHVGDAEIQPTRTLAVRRREKTQRTAVEKKTRWHACLTQEPLHAAMG
jgi:hypothetical protein